MRLHREARKSLLIIAVSIVVVNFLVVHLTHDPRIVYSILGISLALYLFAMYFFRYVERVAVADIHQILAPCDGRVVVVEETDENEYFNDKRVKISIFMSPLDVHMNWYPVSGMVLKALIHRGSHLVAWAPKSSLHNERSSIIIETADKHQVLVRQIAGAVARRVVMYAKEGEYAEQGGNLGFIKFGSRMDIYLPVGTIDVKVSVGQVVKGNITEIARFNN